jgi:hypothetical protein
VSGRQLCLSYMPRLFRLYDSTGYGQGSNRCSEHLHRYVVRDNLKWTAKIIMRPKCNSLQVTAYNKNTNACLCNVVPSAEGLEFFGYRRVRNQGHSLGGGGGWWWCVRPGRKKPKGGKIGGKMNILNKEGLSALNNFCIIEPHTKKFNQKIAIYYT